MPVVNYKKNSVYSLTPQTATYLDYFVLPTVVSDFDDEFYQLEHRHQYRPDLLSYEKYGTSYYGWVFMVRNPDLIKDPVWDMREGLRIFIPKKSNIQIGG